MNYETIRYEISEGVLTITLDRPEQLNAFTVKMGEELIDAFERASAEDEVRAVIVTGAGRAFCAGMDLSASGNVFGLDETQRPSLRDMHERLDDPVILKGVRDIGGRVTLAIFDCAKPVIAAINGAAVGIGATMTLAMDIRLASEKARIGFVFGKIGIVPEACSSWFLPRIVGISQALEWIYGADIFDAVEAQRSGLVKKAVAPSGCSTKHERSLGASSITALRWRSHWPVRCCIAIRLSHIRSKRIASIHLRCSIRALETARRALVRSSGKERLSSQRASPAICRRSTTSGFECV